MKKISQQWPEVVFGSAQSSVSQAIHRALKAGQLKKIAPRLYTANLHDAFDDIIKRHLYAILGHLYPGAVLSHRTALEGGPSAEGLIVLSYKYSKSLSMPGFTIRLIKGPGALPGDTAFMESLFLASRERALLENLQISRAKKWDPKTLSQAFIEEFLDKLCRIYGEEELKKIRDRARPLCKTLKMETAFNRLELLVGTLMGTQYTQLQTKSARARSQGQPYDSPRLELFATLFAHLQQAPLPIRPSTIHSEIILQQFAFFESYFSNYIEGTQFEVKEARDIVFNQKLIRARPQDSHDILGTFQLISSAHEMRKTPHSVEELFALLKNRHQILMSARPEKMPGQFKEETNRFGHFIFVDPTLVKGTFIKAFDFYKNLRPGIARAIFMMFIIAEIHPFLDGNGRIARVMMNAELESADECRIIIPTVFREDYLLALRRLSKSNDPKPYIKMLLRAQEFSASIDFSDYQSSIQQLEKCGAFLDPTDGKLQF